MCFDRNINGNRDVKFLIGIIGHCTDERNLLYYIYANKVGGSKKVQTFAEVIYGWSPCEKDLKRVLQKNHNILTIAKFFFESINNL